jgi:biopolymer transport protein ExbD
LSEINVTPLIDLAFVLLIIFIITTPLLEKSIELLVPTSATAERRVDPKSVQIIHINRDEVITLNKETIDLAEMEDRLRELKARIPTVAVVVRPHKELPVQKFVDIMDAIQRAGVTRAGVMTREPREQE